MYIAYPIVQHVLSRIDICPNLKHSSFYRYCAIDFFQDTTQQPCTGHCWISACLSHLLRRQCRFFGITLLNLTFSYLLYLSHGFFLFISTPCLSYLHSAFWMFSSSKVLRFYSKSVWPSYESMER